MPNLRREHLVEAVTDLIYDRVEVALGRPLTSEEDNALSNTLAPSVDAGLLDILNETTLPEDLKIT